jgi:hypothetical protein
MVAENYTTRVGKEAKKEIKTKETGSRLQYLM